jgi:hypothetical protein
MNLHRSDCRTRKFNRSSVSEHFHLEGHSFNDVSLPCIEHNTQWSDVTRKSRETYWIRRLNTLEPSTQSSHTQAGYPEGTEPKTGDDTRAVK